MEPELEEVVAILAEPAEYPHHLADRVILRDGALCRIPGCSRPADHVRHLIPRWACGPLEPWNELSLCAIHHLRGVHGGSVRVTGRAPDGLAFTLGEREVAAARA